MKPKLFFLAGIFCYMQLAEAQTSQPFARHYWLNPQGVNYTLSTPTSDRRWIIAAPRNERLSNGTYATRKNTIAVFKVENADYAILPTATSACSDEVSVIGEPNTGTGNGVFNPDVDFDVHCVVESCNPDKLYILCGSISERPGDPYVGMVAILDASLKLQSLRRYPEVSIFYSVYAQDGYYFVCGQMQAKPYGSTAIVLRDAVSAPLPQQSITAFHTINNPNWVFHKIAVRKDPNYKPCSFEFSVSGRENDPTKPSNMGWAVFQMSLGFFTFSNAAYYFNTGYYLNSKATIANYPPVAPLSNPQGLLLSASTGSEILTYVFHDNQTWIMDTAFKIPWQGVLEDMDCGGTGSPYPVAWVGNGKQTGGLPTADYIRSYVAYPSSPPFPLPTPTLRIYFTPFNATPGNNAYYSLHKVHYNEKDGQFHAGGYCNEAIGGTSNQNRTTFAVTPELIKDYNICTKRDIPETKFIDTLPPTPLPIARVYTRGWDVEGITRKYGFCTMDCEGRKNEDCGNQLFNDGK